MPTPHREYGAMLREARHRAGLTQAALGAAVGIDQAYISNAEAGRDLITKPETVAKLVDALGINPYYVDTLWALAGRIPPDLEQRIAGNEQAIRIVRAALGDTGHR